MNEQYITISAEILEGTYHRVMASASALGLSWDKTIDMILYHSSGRIVGNIDKEIAKRLANDTITSNSVKSDGLEGNENNIFVEKLDNCYQEVKDDLTTIQTAMAENVDRTSCDISLIRTDLDNRLQQIELSLNRVINALENYSCQYIPEGGMER